MSVEESFEGLEPKVMTLGELCAYLRVHSSTVYRLLYSQQIPAFRVGRCYRFSKIQIDNWTRELAKTSKTAEAQRRR